MDQEDVVCLNVQLVRTVTTNALVVPQGPVADTFNFNVQRSRVTEPVAPLIMLAGHRRNERDSLDPELT